MDSFKEGAIVTGVTIGGYMTLKYLFKVSPPSAKLDINDVVKLGLGIVSGVLVKIMQSSKNGSILCRAI